MPENTQSWQIPLDQRSWEKHNLEHFSGLKLNIKKTSWRNLSIEVGVMQNI